MGGGSGTAWPVLTQTNYNSWSLLMRVIWYVSNVSIIFDAPCLFLHHLLSVSLYFVVFLYIFWNEPINEMPQCQFPIFCYFVFQKSYTGNILGIGRNKSQTSKYLTELPEDRRGDGAEPEGGHTIGRHGLGLAHALWWCGPPGPPLTLPLRL
jgi:hypothetical protein